MIFFLWPQKLTNFDVNELKCVVVGSSGSSVDGDDGKFRKYLYLHKPSKHRSYFFRY